MFRTLLSIALLCAYFITPASGQITRLGGGQGGFITAATDILTIAAPQGITITVSAGLAWVPGARVRVIHSSSAYMEGVIFAYSGNSMTVSIDRKVGSGTFATWAVNPAGDVGPAVDISGKADKDNPTFTGTVTIGTTVLCSAIGSNAGTSYTLSAAQNGCILRFTAATDVTLTVPAGLPAGFSVLIVQRGAGAVIPTASGVTIRQRQSQTKTAGQYAIASLVADIADDYILSGDLQ